MTENEIIKNLDEIWTFGHEPTENERLAANKAITLIQELQQYRTIGTVEELQSILVEISEGQDDVDDSGISVGLLHTLLEHAAYSKLGTVKECREAVERQQAIEPIKEVCGEETNYKCQCGCGYLTVHKCGFVIGDMPNYCGECGRKLNWENIKKNLEGYVNIEN